MKKISFKNLEALSVKQLTMEEMRDIYGGRDLPPVEADCQANENCRTKCSQGKYCTTCCNA